MEVIIISTLVSRIALSAIDRFVTDNVREYVEDEEDITSLMNLQPSTNSNHTENMEILPNAEPNITLDATPNATSDATEADDVASLEAKVKSLRAEAAQLTSADTFVQYARVTRQANKLEKQLKELKGDDEEPLGGNFDFDRMTRTMSNMLAKRATQSARKGVSKKMIAKLLIRLTLLLCLWWHFSYGREQTTRGEVMRIDCSAVRPFAWMFRQHDVSCAEEDWTCAAQSSQLCGISYIIAASVCNAAVSVVVDAAMKFFAPRLIA